MRVPLVLALDGAAEANAGPQGRDRSNNAAPPAFGSALGSALGSAPGRVTGG
jgi:hypothetical protein